MIGFVLLLPSSNTVTVVVTHSIPSIMRLVTALLYYLWTLHQDEVVAWALICCILPSVFSSFYNFIQLLYSSDGIGRSLAIGSVLVLPGILIFCLYISNTYPYTSRLLSLLLPIIFCFTFILAGLYGEITSPSTWKEDVFIGWVLSSSIII